MDPVQELCYFGIDTWVIGLCTATAPADHPYKVPRVTTGTNQRSPAVPLKNPGMKMQRHNNQTRLVEQHQSTMGSEFSWGRGRLLLLDIIPAGLTFHKAIV